MFCDSYNPLYNKYHLLSLIDCILAFNNLKHWGMEQQNQKHQKRFFKNAIIKVTFYIWIYNITWKCIRNFVSVSVLLLALKPYLHSKLNRVLSNTLQDNKHVISSSDIKHRVGSLLFIKGGANEFTHYKIVFLIFQWLFPRDSNFPEH